MGHGGQGILPSSTSGSQSTFPRPEVGILEDSRWKKFLPRHLAIARVPAFSAAVMEEGTPKARVTSPHGLWAWATTRSPIKGEPKEEL